MEPDVIVLDERMELTLGQVCELSGVHAEAVIALVEEGLVDPSAGLERGPTAWRFTGAALNRVQGILRLQRDLALDPSGAAMVLELREELDRLRARLRALESLLHD